MATNNEIIDIGKILAILSNEEELIIKPFQPGSANETGAIECGKIVSRTNKALFDYQIGDKTNRSVFNSIFTQRFTLTLPGTKQIVAEFYENRLPLLCRACCQQDVRCLTTVSGQNQTIGSVRQGYVEIKSTLFSKRKRK